MSGTSDRQRPRPGAQDDAVWGTLWRLAVPLGFVVAVFAAEAGALALAARHYSAWSDFAWIGLVTIGSGLPATFLGVGSIGVVGVRWPRVEAAVAGALAIAVLAVLAQQVISGAAATEGMITPSGRASLVFALWVLQWTVSTTVVAFLCGRAAAGWRLPTATSASRA